MCGIAGIYLRQASIEGKLLDGLAGRLAHRGPDKIKTHLDEGLGLAHTRLSIIDLAGGDQPLFADNGRLALVANGEIYNFIELRRDLESLGAVFSTHSDCETILHAYHYYGDGFLEKLNGMFAFALYDRIEGKLLLARDRLGIKPLFFCETGEGVFFASEQKALFPILPGGPTIQPDALIQSLETRFNTGVQTIVAGVVRLQPGEVATFASGKLISRHLYWSPFDPTISSNRLSFKTLAGFRDGWSPGNSPIAPHHYEEAAEIFEVLMQQIMLEHMRSDVPFALFLSGGVDSSVVLEWLRREEGTRALASYTVAFADAPLNDDAEAAKTIARRFGLQHNVIELDQQTLFNHLPFAVWAADDFIIDPAILPTSLLAREAARDFKVVFSGEGGDELFAGYGRYRRSKLQRWLANLFRPGSGGFRTRGMLGSEWRKHLLGPLLREHLPAGRAGITEAWSSTPIAGSALQRMQTTDMATELTDQLLVKVDRMLMAWGLEGRVPLLDHRLVEFALRLPDELKVRGREGKLFLKRWAEPIFGSELVRRPKSGFTVPVGLFMQGENLLKLRQILPGHRAFSGLFEPSGIAALVSRQTAKRDVHDILWALLQLAVWHRIFIEGNGEKPDVFANPIEFIA